jgi:hypothetical protein
MPEIDMRNCPWNSGIPRNTGAIERDLYSLLAIFAASKELCGRRTDDNDQASVYGYSVREFELAEVGRLLLSMAASCRNDWDYRTETIEQALKDRGHSPEVGTLVKDIARRRESPLLVRESWHKILHSHTMNFARSEIRSIYSGHLEPTVHLYGELKGTQWKASLDIYRWCEVVHALT